MTIKKTNTDIDVKIILAKRLREASQIIYEMAQATQNEELNARYTHKACFYQVLADLASGKRTEEDVC